MHLQVMNSGLTLSSPLQYTTPRVSINYINIKMYYNYEQKCFPLIKCLKMAYIVAQQWQCCKLTTPPKMDV